MSNKKTLEINKQENEADVPYLTWLKDVRREIHEETKGLTPEERGVYWANVRAELALENKQQKQQKPLRITSQPRTTFQTVKAVAI